VGYVGSEAGTQLSNFMGDNTGKPSVVLLDEFDHCDPETWEAFYHIFDEGPT
jgi:ATP-dependent Clp protease ATP-binding subunit ClpA